MDMIGHNDKSQTQSIPLCEFRAEMPYDDPFGPIRIQKSATPVAGKRNKVNVFLVIVNPPFNHRTVTSSLIATAIKLDS